MAESSNVSLAWRTLDAQFFGVAQRRRRVFVVAVKRGMWERRMIGNIRTRQFAEMSFHPADILFEGTPDALFASSTWEQYCEWMPADAESERVALWHGDGVMAETGFAPRRPVRTVKDEALEAGQVADRYYLSEKASRGILDRAAKRGKRLPVRIIRALAARCGENIRPGVREEAAVTHTIPSGTGCRPDEDKEIVVKTALMLLLLLLTQQDKVVQY